MSPDQAHSFLLTRLTECGVSAFEAKILLRELRTTSPVTGARRLRECGLGYREAFDALQLLHKAGDGPRDDTHPHQGLSATMCLALAVGCFAIGIFLSKLSHDDAVALRTDSFEVYHGCFVAGALFLLRAGMKWLRS